MRDTAKDVDQAVAQATAAHGKGRIAQAAQHLLQLLGEATQVSRAYIFRFDREDGRMLATQLFEWCAPGIEPQIDNPDLQGVDLHEAGFGRWNWELMNAHVLSGNVKDFPADERALLEPQEIQSLIVVPILEDHKVWGFMGFDDCEQERDWSQQEHEALKRAATLMAHVIETAKKE